MLKITAIGNLTHDVELKMNENTGKPYAILRIASDRRYKDKDGNKLTDFIAWNGWCLTANILESRNPEGGCSLSAILIPDAPEKYFLSSAQVEKLLYKSSEARKAPVSTTQTE